MALLAKANPCLALKVLLVAGKALIVARTGQHHRFRLLRHMAVIAVQAQLTHVVIMQAVVGRRGSGLFAAELFGGQGHRKSGQQHPTDEPSPALSPGDECKRFQVYPAYFAGRDSGRTVFSGQSEPPVQSHAIGLESLQAGSEDGEVLIQPVTKE